jgi:cell shape-determining protein MreC
MLQLEEERHQATLSEVEALKERLSGMEEEIKSLERALEDSNNTRRLVEEALEDELSPHQLDDQSERLFLSCRSEVDKTMTRYRCLPHRVLGREPAIACRLQCHRCWAGAV